MLTPLLISAGVGYLLGSLPFGYLVARSRGVNIFEVGSRNPGATNVRRVLGSGPGNLVFALDALKGAAAAAAPWLYRVVMDPAGAEGTGVGASYFTYLGIAGLIGAFLGHSFSCFTGFRGGKGVATGAGGFAVLFPVGILIALAVWGFSALVTRYVSLASILAALSLPFTAYFLHRPTVLVGASALIAALVVVRHRANLARLAAGNEPKIGQKRQPVAPGVSAEGKDQKS